MQELINGFADAWRQVLAMTPRLVAACVVLLACFWFGRVLGRSLSGLLAERDGAKVYARFLQQLAVWLFGLFGLFVALNILGLGGLAMSLVAGGGMAAVILGFAFREIGENFIAGFFLAFSRSFEIGDFIESEGLKGEVRAIELRHVQVRSPDGSDIFIPSAQIFKSPLFNYTRDGLRRLSFVVGIDYGDDPETARRVLLETVREAAGVLVDPPPLVVMSGLLPQYMEVSVNFWVDSFDQTQNMAAVRNRVIDGCCRVLKEHDFTFSSDCTTRLSLAADRPIALSVETPGSPDGPPPSTS